jgi:hypothetical protein
MAVRWRTLTWPSCWEKRPNVSPYFSNEVRCLSRQTTIHSHSYYVNRMIQIFILNLAKPRMIHFVSNQ